MQFGAPTVTNSDAFDTRRYVMLEACQAAEHGQLNKLANQIRERQRAFQDELRKRFATAQVGEDVQADAA